MIFFSTLFFISVLSFTSASDASDRAFWNPVFKGITFEMATSMMASNIARDLIRVIDAARGSHISVVDLREELLDTTSNHLKVLYPVLKQFASINIDPEFLAKTVASKINKNEALQRALPRDNYITSRSIDQLVVSWGIEYSTIWDGPEGIID